jgi:hypothetical protein
MFNYRQVGRKVGRKMIVRIMYGSSNPNEEFEKLVECDSMDKVVREDGTLILDFLRDGQISATQVFSDSTGSARVFVMEDGKTVDRIDFPIIRTVEA